MESHYFSGSEKTECEDVGYTNLVQNKSLEDHREKSEGFFLFYERSMFYC